MFEELERRRRSAFADGPGVRSTNGWVRIPYDARRFIEHYAPLRLKSGYELWVYQNGGLGNSSTKLFAVPQGCTWEYRPEPLKEDLGAVLRSPADDRPYLGWTMARGSPMQDPRPPEALPHFMEAVEGDGSPRALLYASFLARDGEELGAGWHGCVWRTHRLVTKSPFLEAEEIEPLARRFYEVLQASPLDAFDFLCKHVSDGWKLQQKLRRKRKQGKTYTVTTDDLFQRITWSVAQLHSILRSYQSEIHQVRLLRELVDAHRLPPELSDLLQWPGCLSSEWQWLETLPTDWTPRVQGREVTFYSYTGLRKERIERHRDVYAPGSYCPERHMETIGRGQGGYMF